MKKFVAGVLLGLSLTVVPKVAAEFGWTDSARLDDITTQLKATNVLLGKILVELQGKKAQ